MLVLLRREGKSSYKIQMHLHPPLMSSNTEAVKTPTEVYNERASVTLCLLGAGLQPADVTQRLGVEPTFFINGMWCFETNPARKSTSVICHPRVASSDVNEHLRHLLRVFGPLKREIESLGSSVSLVVHVGWEASEPL